MCETQDFQQELDKKEGPHGSSSRPYPALPVASVTAPMTSSTRATEAPTTMEASRVTTTITDKRTPPAYRGPTKRPWPTEASAKRPTEASGWVLEASILSTRIAAQCPRVRTPVED